ncbi:MAG: ImmA/IrrE family metallo-endopeptidase [Anaerolineales bacterium]
MIPTTREERRWFVQNLARGLADYTGATEPPVPVEELLTHPPDLYKRDFGVVEMFSSLWDATFARPLTRRGNIFVHNSLDSAKRRFALARETLSALITSAHGRRMGLTDLLLPDLRYCAEQFALAIVAPDHLVQAYRDRGGKIDEFAETFGIPPEVASARWEDAPTNSRN